MLQRLHARSAAALVAAVVVLAHTAWAQSGEGTIRGVVVFDDVSYNEMLERGERGPRARVELRGKDGRRVDGPSTTTDKVGSYALERVTAGHYVLRIISPGYRTYQTELYLPSDFECRWAIVLERR